jgi:membrane protease YdiL (CAAX protease family)
MENEPSEVQSGPQLVSPLPVRPRLSPVVRVFIGNQGLRAGWRFLLYLIAVKLLLALSTSIVRHVFGSGPGLETPAKAILGELLMFLSAAIPAFFASLLEKRPWGAYGLPLRGKGVPQFFTGLAIGFSVLSVLLFMIHLSHGFYLGSMQLHGAELAHFAILWGIAFVLVGFAEEFMFRGYPLFTLASGSSFWVSGILLSAIFGAVHLGNGGESWFGALNAGLVGLIFVFSLWRTGSLWFAVGAHASWDWAESFFYGVPDSGNKSIGTLFNPHFAGSNWITGGAVGPEASIYALVALILLALSVHLLYPERRWCID